jgi:hypothetical protein
MVKESTLVQKKSSKSIRIDGVDGHNYLEANAKFSFVKKVINVRIKLYNLPGYVLYFISKDNSDIELTSIAKLFSSKKAHAEIATLLRNQPQTLEAFNQFEGTLQNIVYSINH